MESNTTKNLTVLGVLALIIAAVLGFVFVKDKVHDGVISQSTCGEAVHPGGTLQASDWHIGPVLSESQGGNKSPGMPPHPTQSADGPGWYFDFPTQPGHKVDYLTFRHGSLAGKTRIRMRYRVEAAEGVKIYAPVERETEAYGYVAQLTPYFQRSGDNWTGRGQYETYRWYGTFVAPNHLRPGEYELTVSLDGAWAGIQSSGSDSPGFREAIQNAGCVGFVFGGNNIGWGHGAAATGPARFTLLEFSVE